MIIDYLGNASRYEGLGEPFARAFTWLRANNLEQLEKGRHEIAGDRVFALVNEYDTVDPAGEKMEAHRAHTDLQYMVRGNELVGHGFLKDQKPSQAYEEATDFMLFCEQPDFYSRLDQGMFAIFFPEDLHMPNLQTGAPCAVRKIVIKIKVPVPGLPTAL